MSTDPESRVRSGARGPASTPQVQGDPLKPAPTRRQPPSSRAASFRGVPSHLQAVYYRASDGSEPVNEFMDSLSVREQVVIDNQVERINLLSPSKPHLPFPHSSQIEGELRELRCHYGSTLYRILYRRSRNLLILLHMLRKDTGRIPAEDILIAKRRWDDFKARMDAERRMPPRAAGHDAP